ncbi:NAD(P)H-binding protein [Thermomonas sp.]|uniref:NAD(P)H-binding protein n=1 Tax=Thermomonas sp. TaxID=1971895 RepID=UPI0026181EE4|nr:NAD(P)H-binding protein [Thermomonas sp.]MCO5055760.1 NAD(P)H-binding protein [Thermomonas sp.]
MNTPRRRVLVAGATGLVGASLVACLCEDPGVAEVHALARRDLPCAHPTLRVHRVDFAALPALPPVDEVYLALGTTIAVAGSQAAFRAVDFDANLAVARAAQAAGARRLGLVSAMGANTRSQVFYNRVKGELEAALAVLGFDGLVIARPSLLRGNRTALGQPLRAGELRWAKVDALLRPLLPRGLRAIDGSDVAAALAATVPNARGRVLLTSAMMQDAQSRAAQIRVTA